jgi:hypothetical protein
MPVPELGSYVQKGEALKASKREADRKRAVAIPAARLGGRSQAENLVGRGRVDTW